MHSRGRRESSCARRPRRVLHEAIRRVYRNRFHPIGLRRTAEKSARFENFDARFPRWGQYSVHSHRIVTSTGAWHFTGNDPMIADPCPHPDELRRLLEERLGPVREAEIEAHVEACQICQDQLERLTARRAWC